MPSMGLILFLAISAFLCLTPGADALKCRLCMMLKPGASCLPAMSCNAEPGKEICYSRIVYENGIVHQRFLNCKSIEDAQCDTTKTLSYIKRIYENKCCKDTDFCNEFLGKDDEKDDKKEEKEEEVVVVEEEEEEEEEEVEEVEEEKVVGTLDQ
ncbi:hypothetical protein lerEdw1_013949 [Lerista edwardsae]|nr:hypothetical protein lerEdw1_013950 [Lerista edwardsae]KAJ6634571.1 hypothetical protein lerEdw1_013949 [Lerista edwardsae]